MMVINVVSRKLELRRPPPTFEHNPKNHQKCVVHFEFALEELGDQDRGKQKGDREINNKIRLKSEYAASQVGLFS